MDGVKDVVRNNLDVPFIGGLLEGAPDSLYWVLAIVLLFAAIGSIVLLITNAARGFQFLALASRDPMGAVKRVVNPGDHRREIEALRIQLNQVQSKIDAMNRPWIRMPDFVSDAYGVLARTTGGLLSAEKFAELRNRMSEVLKTFPDSKWAQRNWIDATQGLADDAAKCGQYLLAASRYREAIKRAEGLLKRN